MTLAQTQILSALRALHQENARERVAASEKQARARTPEQVGRYNATRLFTLEYERELNRVYDAAETMFGLSEG